MAFGVGGDVDARVAGDREHHLDVLADEPLQDRLHAKEDGVQIDHVRLEDLLACRGTPPPKPEVLARALGLPVQRLTRFLGDLLRSGRIVKVASDVYLIRRDMDAWRDSARRLLEEVCAEFYVRITCERAAAASIIALYSAGSASYAFAFTYKSVAAPPSHQPG